MDPHKTVFDNLIATQKTLNNDLNQQKVNIASYDIMINDLRQSIKNINRIQLENEINQCKQQVMQLRNHNKELEIILNNEKSSRSNLMSSLTNTKERTESYKRDNDNKKELMLTKETETLRQIQEEKSTYEQALQILDSEGNNEVTQVLKSYLTS